MTTSYDIDSLSVFISVDSISRIYGIYTYLGYRKISVHGEKNIDDWVVIC